MFTIIKPFNLAGKFFGSSAFDVTSKNYVITKKGFTYSVLMNIIGIIFTWISLYYCSESSASMKLKLLIFGRTILSYICFFADIIMTVCLRDRLASAFDHLQLYDVTSKFSDKTHGQIKSIHSKIIAPISLICWMIIAFFAYQSEDHELTAIYSGIGYLFIYAGLSMQILNFCGLMVMIYQRFNHLCQLIVPEGNFNFFFFL